MELTPVARGGVPVREEAVPTERARARPRLLEGPGVARLVLGIALLAAWQFAGMGVVDRFWVSSPLLVLQRFGELAVTGALTRHLWATLEVGLYGLALGMAAGVLAGTILGLSERASRVLDPFIMFFYTLPRIGLAPLFIMYLGVGVVSKVALTFTMVVFVALLNTYEGVRSVDPTLVDMLRTMRASRRQIIQWVVLPSIVPWILSTLRIGIGLALIGAIVAEMISASRGIGWYMQRSAGTFDVTGVFAGMFILAFTAVAMNALVGRLEKKLLAWRAC